MANGKDSEPQRLWRNAIDPEQVDFNANARQENLTRSDWATSAREESMNKFNVNDDQLNHDENKCSLNNTKFQSSQQTTSFHHSNRFYPKCLDLHLNDENKATTIEELNDFIEYPRESIDDSIVDRVRGSIIGMALGDAVGAPTEFRPYEYLQHDPVTDLKGGGTWALDKGKFTDDTSMALCLASSLIICEDFVPYDQLVRYKWWYRYGYMSSTGDCFDIGNATRESLEEFIKRQQHFADQHHEPIEHLDDFLSNKSLENFDVYCSYAEVAGNGALMRLAPVPLFFHRNIISAIEFSGRSGQITHGDQIAYDSCRYYGALIVAAIRGFTKDQLTQPYFYVKYRKWFGNSPLHDEVAKVANGSYLNRAGHQDGIRGGGFIIKALEAALWAFWSTDNFRDGVLAAVNLGDDTDTTAAIYGQLAGAFYGYKQLPADWCEHLYAKDLIVSVGEWLAHLGNKHSINNWSQLTKRNATDLVGSSSKCLKKMERNNNEKVLRPTSTWIDQRSNSTNHNCATKTLFHNRMESFLFQ